MVVEARLALQSDPGQWRRSARDLDHKPRRQRDPGFLVSPDKPGGVFWMGATSPGRDNASSSPLGVVRSNGYCDDNSRSVSTVHGCNTSLDHGQTLLLSIGTRVAVRGERFVRPRRTASVVPG